RAPRARGPAPGASGAPGRARPRVPGRRAARRALGGRPGLRPRGAVAVAVAVEDDAARGELLAQAQEGQVLALGLEHDVELEARRRLAHEVLEADRVDEVGVGAQLGQDEPRL